MTTHKIVIGFDDATIEAVSLTTGERKVLVRGGYFGRYVPTSDTDGYLVYVHEGALLAVHFDPAKLAITSAPVTIGQDVAANAADGNGNFAFAADGTFIYRAGDGPSRKAPIRWLDASGKTEPLIEPGTFYTLRFSPDGTKLALAVDYGDRGREIAVYDPARGSLTRLTFTQEVNVFPCWTPDGQFIAFESSSPTGYGIAIVRADGGGPDGKTLAYHQWANTGFDIWTAAVTAGSDGIPRLGIPVPFLKTPFSESNPAYSPDGQWLAYTSDESDARQEVYVRAASGSGANYRLSTVGGRAPMWNPHGHTVFWVGADQRLMTADYEVRGGAFVPGKPRVWSSYTMLGSPFGGGDQALASTGDRFAILTAPPVPTRASGHVTFMTSCAGACTESRISVGAIDLRMTSTYKT